MKLSATIALLLEAKAAPEIILRAVVEYEAAQADALEQRREHDRLRQERKRAKEALSRDITLRHSDRPLTGGGDARGLDKTSTQRIEPQEQKVSKTPQAALETVLDPGRAREVVAHRQRIRKPLTAYGAELLAKALGSLPVSAAEGADAMISNGWQGVKAEYFDNRPRAGPAMKTAVPSQSEVFALIARKSADDHQRPDDSGSPRPALPHLSLVGTG